MPLFMSDVELEREGGDVSVVVSRAEVYIRELQQQVETHKARADAAAINAEQTCALIEQKFLALTAQFSLLENEKEQTVATMERRSTELAQVQAQMHKLEIEAIKHHSTTERLSFELGELSKSKRELLEVVEHKNTELDEKNASIKSYLTKVVELTTERSVLEGKVHEHEAEVLRSRATQSRLSQEKELIEQHNSFLNEELTAKVSALLEERHNSAETMADLRSKLAEAERAAKEAEEALHRENEHSSELQAKLNQTREELKFTTEDAAIKEEQFNAEISMATKLVELYKQSSDEWSQKSHDLEAVIKALEAHLNEVEAAYKEKLDDEMKAREKLVKEAAEVKQKLDMALVEVNNNDVKSNKDEGFLSLPYKVPIEGQLAFEFPGDGSVVPALASEVSGTALAAALLRDGWSLAKMYSKYQEAVDAWRHEKQERRHSQSLLERVLHEIEIRAAVIMDERVEHREMMQAYKRMEEKLQNFMEDQNAIESSYKDLKAELWKKERELKGQHKEIADLQIQVAVLLKECADVQQRFGVGDQNGEAMVEFVTSVVETTAVDTVISDRLLTFKDIRGMVEHNSQLRALVRSLAQQNEQKEQELKQGFEAELKQRLDELGRKVADTMKRSEEQSDIINRLQGTVGMYRRLYEEEVNARRASQHTNVGPVAEHTGQDLRQLLDASKEEIAKLREAAAARTQSLEAELDKTRSITNARVERARADAEAASARDQLISLRRETENQRKEMGTVLARNMEFSQAIIDYQRKLRESSQKLQASEELGHRQSIEVAVLEKEKAMLASAEKRASEEVASLSERVHRLQASLDTFQTVEEAREGVRAVERRKLEDEVNKLQKEWAEAKTELEMERAHGQNLIAQRDKAVSEALERVEVASKELAEALKAVSTAETRAQVAEARCLELELRLKSEDKDVGIVARAFVANGKYENLVDLQIALSLQQAREELDQVKEELAAAKAHTDQYKSIAEVSEEALKQMEAVYISYKEEAEQRKGSMETEVRALRKHISDLETEISEKDKASGDAAEEKEKALNSALREIAVLKDSEATKQVALDEAEQKNIMFKQEVEKLRLQWRDAQNNYERQVLLQADTIRELTVTSDKLSKLENLEKALHGRAEKSEAELESLKVAWAVEKSALEAAKVDAEKKVKELDKQNQLLLDRLEGVHIVAAETERKAAGILSNSGQSSEAVGESDLQNVIRYLRRSKETVDTELSLMKQERIRLQKQLEAAYHAAEEAQASLRREHESARASFYTDEEFRTLQAQVRELNLLRESNAELREENRTNFEDCREWRDKAREAQAELEPVRKLLREKEVELEASGRTLDIHKQETLRWEKRVKQLLEKYRAVDVDDYQRVKDELAAIQKHDQETVAELVVTKKEVEVLKVTVSQIEEERETKGSRLVELEARVTELDQKLQEAVQAEGKLDALGKEKEEASKEIESLTKQIEELRSNAGKRAAGDQSVAARQEALSRQEAVVRQEREESLARQEQAQRETESQLREKETRIQALERSLEKEKQEAKQSKLRRQKDLKQFYDVVQKAAAEKKRFLDELENLKREKAHYQSQSHANGAGPLEEATVNATEIDERAASYQAATNEMAELAAEAMREVPSTSTPATPPVPSSSDLSSFIETTPGMIEGPAAVGTLIESIPPPSTMVATPPTAAPSAGRGLTNSMPVPIVTLASSVATVPSTTVAVPAAGSGIRPVIRPALANVAPTPARPPVRLIPAPTAAGTAAVASAVVPAPTLASSVEREREIMQLRARIQEQEARKTTRRLIRPRIEPASTQEPSSEAADLEGAGEGVETDVEVVAETREAVPSEAVEITPVVSTLMPAVPSDVASASVSMGEVSIASTITALPTAAVLTVRKRSAPLPESSFADDFMHQETKTEDVPPQKKSRAVEDTLMEDIGMSSLDKSILTAAEDHPVEEIAKGLEVTETQTELIPTGLDLTEMERDHPATDMSEAPVQKRPRFLRPDLAPIPSIPPEEISVLQSDDHNVLPGAEGLEVLRQDGESVEAPLDSSTADKSLNVQENSAPALAVSLSDAVVVTLLDASTNDAQAQLIDIAATNAVDDALAQFEKGSAELDMSATFGTEVAMATVEEQIITVVEVVVDEGEMQVIEETEEGEIVSEIVEPEGTEADAITLDSQEGEMEEPAMKETDEVNIVSITDQAVESTEEGGDLIEQELAPAPVPVDKPENDQSTEATPSGTEEQEGQVEASSGNRTRLATSVVAKPAGRGTTINLADRAKERAALRKVGVSPPSPGARGGRARGTRGGKRGGASGRGRLISTGVGGRQAGAGGDGTTSTQQAGVQASPVEASQSTTTPNPFEALKDEQS
ncbi:unnamed protein product [Sphagnum jensenii]|uniref:Nucleoprotein TPR/MLP1 domain-containing protein n=1 Tax=Sphagnum jensenii TaxID=128206 RepID=A0ABP1BJZ2_9BRYO